ncbi:MAG: 30S ribosomal protein S17 [Kiloniellales bacterium]|nr:30S ribosomal protein S17 [Kiloniellales bacterium]
MPRRILQGVVVSSKADKTVTVLVERRVMHPVYKKFIKRSKRYHAHDENNKVQVGDTVRIRECAPISKTKSWMVIEDSAAAAAG